DISTVVTFPIGVRSNRVKPGLLITPIIADYIAREFQIPSVIALNVLDSYEKRFEYIKPYLKILKEMDIEFNRIWIDEENKNQLTNNLHILYKKQILKKKMNMVYSCDCGKVQFVESAFKNIHKGARLYEVKNTEVICNSCNSSCDKVEQEVLTISFSKETIKKEIFPKLMVKEVKELDNRLTSMEYLVSRNRDTGIIFTIEGKKFNIDVDFFWLGYLNQFSDNHYILVGSNHVTWHLCLASRVVQSLNPETKITLVLTPYVYNKNNVDENSIPLKKEIFKWIVYSHITWKKQDTNWNQSLISQISRIEQLKSMCKHEKYHYSYEKLENSLSFLNANNCLKK
ncbi:hypothetical protein FZM63_15725, partial [Listeria monocytogenes]|nr:hypothetical protein [Listeria monocytogenes]